MNYDLDGYYRDISFMDAFRRLVLVIDDDWVSSFVFGLAGIRNPRLRVVKFGDEEAMKTEITGKDTVVIYCSAAEPMPEEGDSYDGYVTQPRLYRDTLPQFRMYGLDIDYRGGSFSKMPSYMEGAAVMSVEIWRDIIVNDDGSINMDMADVISNAIEDYASAIMDSPEANTTWLCDNIELLLRHREEILASPELCAIPLAGYIDHLGLQLNIIGREDTRATAFDAGDGVSGWPLYIDDYDYDYSNECNNDGCSLNMRIYCPGRTHLIDSHSDGGLQDYVAKLDPYDSVSYYYTETDMSVSKLVYELKKREKTE